MKNYLNYDILCWYSLFAVLMDISMDNFGGIWSSSWMHYIIMATLAYLIVGIIWWIVKHWKEESQRHRFWLTVCLIADASCITLDFLYK